MRSTIGPAAMRTSASAFPPQATAIERAKLGRGRHRASQQRQNVVPQAGLRCLRQWRPRSRMFPSAGWCPAEGRRDVRALRADRNSVPGCRRPDQKSRRGCTRSPSAHCTAEQTSRASSSLLITSSSIPAFRCDALHQSSVIARFARRRRGHRSISAHIVLIHAVAELAKCPRRS